MEPLSALLLLKWLAESARSAVTPMVTPGPTPLVVPQGTTTPPGDLFLPHGAAAGVPADQNAPSSTAASSSPSSATSNAAPVSSATPPFSGRGDPHWEPDIPPPPAVIKRAQELLSSLWAKGVGSYVQETTNGRAITYLAEWHGPPGTVKGITAFRMKGSGSSVSGLPAYGYLYG